jgi:uncharacterized protein (DUF983 family)
VGWINISSLFNTIINSKCPQCGKGSLYSTGLNVNDKCSDCGLNLMNHDCGDGPAVFSIFILGFSIIPLAILIDFSYSPPYLFHIIIWPLIILFSSVYLIKKIKSFFIFKKYQHH